MTNYNVFLEKATSHFKKLYSDEGIDIDVSPTSNFGKILAELALLASINSQEIEKAKQDLTYRTSTKPDYALNNFLHFRKQPAPAKKTLTITGSASFTIPIGTLTAISVTTGLIFKNETELVTNTSGSVTGTFVCEIPGTIGNLPVNDVTIKGDAPSGFTYTSITDSYVGSGGQNQETDSMYKQRWENTRDINGFWTLEAIESEIYRQNGVIEVSSIDNKLNTPVTIGTQTLEPHSNHFVVKGGVDQDIWNSIYKKADQSIPSNGDIIGFVADNKGVLHEVKFSRPTAVPVYYQITDLTGTVAMLDVENNVKKYIDSTQIGEQLNYLECTNYLQKIFNENELKNVVIKFSKDNVTFDYILSLLYYEEAVNV